MWEWSGFNSQSRQICKIIMWPSANLAYPSFPRMFVYVDRFAKNEICARNLSVIVSNLSIVKPYIYIKKILYRYQHNRTIWWLMILFHQINISSKTNNGYCVFFHYINFAFFFNFNTRFIKEWCWQVCILLMSIDLHLFISIQTRI